MDDIIIIIDGSACRTVVFVVIVRVVVWGPIIFIIDTSARRGVSMAPILLLEID